METAPAAIPVNPKTAAIIATIKKITAQRNISVYFICELNKIKVSKTMPPEFISGFLYLIDCSVL